MDKICPTCHVAILDSYYFCPKCGRKLKASPASTTIYSQVKIYVLSILLPPLGLVPGIQYLFDKNSKAKIIGIIAIILTVISAVVTVWFSAKLIANLNNQINTQLPQYQNIGL